MQSGCPRFQARRRRTLGVPLIVPVAASKERPAGSSGKIEKVQARPASSLMERLVMARVRGKCMTLPPPLYSESSGLTYLVEGGVHWRRWSERGVGGRGQV